MKLTYGFAIFLLSSVSLAGDDYWPNYPVSVENSVFLVSEILEGSSKEISPATENCQDSKLLNLCGQDRLEILKNFDKKQNDLIDGWMEEIKKSENVKEIKSSCSEHIEKIQPEIHDGLSWMQNLIDNKIVETHSLRTELLKDFDQKFSAESDQKKLMVKWKDFCEGNAEPYANTYAEIYFANMLFDSRYKGIGKEFCEKIAQNDFTWLKNFILSSSAVDLSADLKNNSQHPQEKKLEIQNRIVKRSFDRNQPRYLDGYFQHEKFSKIIKEINGNECDIYPRNKSPEEQICWCINVKIKDELYGKIKKDYESKILQVEDKIKSIYKKMVDSSILTTSEKEKLIQHFPAPKISLNLFSGALTGSSYGSDILEPPFTSKINLSPAIIHALTQYPQDSLSEMNLSALSHELGHHFFTSLIGKNKMYASLSKGTQEKFQQFSDCVDKTSIDRELLPAFRGNLKIDSNKISSIISNKRPEIGADVFASQVNQMEIGGMKWKKENGAMINCLMVDAVKSKESQLRYLQDSHTSPEARIDIITNPPDCGSILWNKN